MPNSFSLSENDSERSRLFDSHLQGNPTRVPNFRARWPKIRNYATALAIVNLPPLDNEYWIFFYKNKLHYFYKKKNSFSISWPFFPLWYSSKNIIFGNASNLFSKKFKYLYLLDAYLKKGLNFLKRFRLSSFILDFPTRIKFGGRRKILQQTLNGRESNCLCSETHFTLDSLKIPDFATNPQYPFCGSGGQRQPSWNRGSIFR